MAIPKIKVGDVVTAFDQDYVVLRLDEDASDFDMWTNWGWCNSSDVTKLVRRTVTGWRHRSVFPQAEDNKVILREDAFEWKRKFDGRVVRVIRKRTWRKEGAK